MTMRVDFSHGRACLYTETYVDVLVKHMTMNARWQTQQLKDEFASHSLLSPACGLGPATVEIADRVFEVLAETGNFLNEG